MRLAAGRAPGRKAIRCMAGGSYRMLSPDSGRRPRAAVELLGKLSFNVEAQPAVEAGKARCSRSAGAQC